MNINEYIYTDKKDGRQRLVYVDENGKHSSKSYPRILMEQKLGRPLKPNEDVHHKDGNPLNNNTDNLEIIEHGEHQRRHQTIYHDTIQTCQVCGKQFVYTAKQMCNYIRDQRRNKHRGITCSRRCAYYFGTQEQFRRNSEAECGLNGEPFPNGNTVPNEK